MSLWDALNDWPNREDDGADLKAVLDQNLAWLDLASAENPKKAAELGKRLRAEPQDAYQSARLELLSAAAFRSAGWVLDWEPTLLGTNKTVEFRATRDSDTCLVEARLSGPERVIGDHRDVTDPLAELISDLRLPCLLMIEWAENPPALAALDDLWPDIKEELGSVCEGETRREIRVRHMGQTYRLVIERFGEGEGVMPSTGILNVNPSTKLRIDVLRKASRYGPLNEPFLIAVWSDVTGRGTEVELHTLYGSHVWNLHLNAGIVDVHRRPDGIFLERDEDGIPRYRQVSAVAAIRTGSTAGEVGDSFLVYHNPHATNPLDPLALPDLNQFVAEKMIWTKGDPDG